MEQREPLKCAESSVRDAWDWLKESLHLSRSSVYWGHCASFFYALELCSKQDRSPPFPRTVQSTDFRKGGNFSLLFNLCL